VVGNGVVRTAVEGAHHPPYRDAILRVDLHLPEVGVPRLWWRAVGYSFNGFAAEAFVDEIAAATELDPVAFRRELLPVDSRDRAVLDPAVGRAETQREGLHGGVAVHASFGA
jgi:CO/xanthine dehydrogenase Mo-binding subunit